MDSLSEQRIETLPGATRKEAYEKIQTVCFLRSLRTYSEHKIAEKAGFGNAEAMYHQLRTWGLTGLLLPKEQGESTESKVVDSDHAQKARSFSPPQEVADASAAAELFSEALDGLARVVEHLEHLSLSYQGGRFAGTYEFVGRSVYLRSEHSEQAWQEVCERYGRDPNAGNFYVDNDSSKAPLGASPYPPRDLVALIAAYALSDRPIELLMEVLYPEHSQEDVEEVMTLLNQTKRQEDKDGLRRTAEQFAAAVYGKKVGRGASVPSPARDHLLACYITERRKAGIADEQIHHDVHEKGYELTKKEFNRLANLKLEFPGT